MVIVTGGAGFIGSAMVKKLNDAGIDDILIVDNLSESHKWKNLVNLSYHDFVHKKEFIKRLYNIEFPNIKAIIHMGACSSTTEKDADYLMQNNFIFSRKIAEYSLTRDIRLIIASSAATYGDGKLGFSDAIETLHQIKPMNMYGYSKHLFDKWAHRKNAFNQLTALKFFNVFGPNEYHKKDQASMVFKAFHQVNTESVIRLFKSYHPDYGDGEQQRDFVYIKDCTDVMMWFIENPDKNGLFNVGSGQARTWNDLAKAVFYAMNKKVAIQYVEMPEAIRSQYQYFTQSTMEKLKKTGYTKPMTPLEDAIKDYVQCYLSKDMAHL